MTTTRYIAIDLGAESGRVMLGSLNRASLELSEIHRFPNTPVTMPGGLRWNIQQLWFEIQTGIEKALQKANGQVHGISTDSWGVDYVLMGKGSPMLAPPFLYRDPRHAPHYQRLLKDPGAPYIFAHTGIQFMSINTLYQLCAERRELLQCADSMLLIGDYINHLVAGSPVQPRTEISLASTSQILDVQKRQWAEPLIEKVKLPKKIFTPLVDSGTVLGPSQFSPTMQTIATASHDTACAVAAVPAESGEDWAYISSGTWSLVGVELKSPVVTERCRELGFTNELGVAGTTRLLKNISGLYILQQCRSMWKSAGKDLSYAEIAALAEKAPPLRSLIRPEADAFGQPGDMPARIAAYCIATNQPVPQDPGQFARCIYESLALLYRKALLELQELTGRTFKQLHIVGGGSQSQLLNQLAADATGLPVIAGPVEATSMGNILLQAAALGHIAPADIRTIVRASCSPKTFHPAQSSQMQHSIERFLNLPVNKE